ncbi:MAG: ADP-glyceromanno-heptose 6-epimerase [Puniceicoccales bacterium]|jgi:ADP-L-glycero-D-manno-heptose 6-epimerase|nr:ADP-glyceromanno-heptose 6-epimerase [Puniceicoccales bacterium]
MGLAESKKILVTGGAGFIGSVLICELNNLGFENILVADFLGTGDKFLNLVPLRFADYFDGDDLLELIEGKDAKLNEITHIFHMGACAQTTECDAAYLMRNNYEYTKLLAHFAEDRNMRFVYASSAATYGDGTNGMSDRCDPTTLRPLNAYAYSKHIFDLYAVKHGLHTYGLKYFNVFGPNEYHKGEMRSVVVKSCESIMATGKVFLFKSYRGDYEDGKQMRDLLYVKDAAAMTIFLGDVPSAVDGIPTHGIYNAGSGVASAWSDVAAAVFSATEKLVDIEFIDMPQELRNKYQYHTCADISKLRNVGYTGEITPLSEAIEDYTKNFILRGMKRLEPRQRK